MNNLKKINSGLLIAAIITVVFFCLLLDNSYAVSDTQGPVVESLSIDADNSEVSPGDTITFTAKITDESGVKDNNNYPCVVVKMPGDSKYSYVYLSGIGNDVYTGTLKITDSFADGEYSVNALYAMDQYDNNTSDRSYNDLSFCVMGVEQKEIYSKISVLNSVTVINTNKTLTNTIINGDLYIAPNAIATLYGVTITGNIYVLGTLRADGINAKYLCTKRMTVGSLAYGNGASSFSGSCTFNSISVSNNVISEVPLRIDSDLLSVNGKLSIKGAYANIATMYVNDNIVNSTSSGKFYLNDIDVGDADSITIKFVTAEGEVFTKNIDIVVGTIDKEGKPNGIPVIKANDISVCEGAQLELLDGVKANDFEDGDITNSLVASPATISTSEPGKHTVSYSVTDSQGAQSTKTINVEIKKHDWDEGAIINDATCTETGKKKYTCNNCLIEKTEEIAAKGHKWKEEYTIDKEATCTGEGSKSIHCSVCGAIDQNTTTAIAAKGHSFGDWVEVTPNTCENHGLKQHSCETCGFTESENLNPKGHEWEDDYTIDVDATCTTDGSKSIHCKNCEVKKDSTVVMATGHSWNEPVYEWENDNSSVRATRYCQNDNKHHETEAVKTTSKVTKAASYSSKGQTTYTACFENEAFKTQVKTVLNIPMLPKKTNTMTVRTIVKSVKVKKLKRKAVTVAPLTVSKAKGRVTYKVAGGNAKSKKALKLNTKTGKVTVKKKTKKGKYTLSILVTATGNTEFKSGSKTVVIAVNAK